MSRPAFYSCNDNQNYFVSNGKTTSRVLQQPGGSSSINLSWNDEESSNANNSDNRTMNNQRQKPEKEITGKIGSRQEEKENIDTSNKMKNDNNSEPKELKEKQESFSRVRQPPGGRSSFIFG